MALDILYFSTSSAGDASGSSWANRAAFLSAGVVSTLITGKDYTSNALEARVGPGTYAITTSFATFSSTAPSNRMPCLIQACDSSGNLWAPPSPGWSAAQVVWSETNMPVFATTTNITTVNHSGIGLRGIKFTASGANTSVVNAHLFADWVSVYQSASNSNAIGIAGSPRHQSNVYVSMSGTSYQAGITAAPTLLSHNLRVQGNLSASSGNRDGVLNTSGIPVFDKICSFNHVGRGIGNTSTGASSGISLTHSVIAQCTGDAYVTASTNSSTAGVVHGCMITGNTGWGANISSTGKVVVQNSRFRNNTAGNITGIGNWPETQDNITTSGSDSDEYVDAASYDFRIKSTSSLWGKGYGAGDQPASASVRHPLLTPPVIG